MSATQWTEADTRRAQQLWDDYLQDHDVSGHIGKTVGIDPVAGGVWFGESIDAVVSRASADGVTRPLFFVRVGSEHFYRKGLAMMGGGTRGPQFSDIYLAMH